jgi:hypothetical protein
MTTAINNTAGAAPSWLELESIRPIPEGERITGLSRDTLRRRYGDHIIKLSPRRSGIKLKTLLAIADGSLRPTPPTP